MEAKKMDMDVVPAVQVLKFSRYHDEGEKCMGDLCLVDCDSDVCASDDCVPAEEMARMTDVTFAPVSYDQFLEDHHSFLVRKELDGVQVCLLLKKHKFVVAVFVDDKQLYSDCYDEDFGEAFQEYMAQVRYVRNLFVQSGRREIFYFRDVDGSVQAFFKKQA